MAGNPACSTSRADSPSNAPGATVIRPEVNSALSCVVARTISPPQRLANVRFDFAREHDTSCVETGKRKESQMKLGVLAVLAVLLCTLPAAAQDWPAKPVKIVVPFGAGATPDVVARLIADYLRDKTQQTFVVENRPGASGNTGTDAVAKAAPDGSTIGVSIGGPLAINTVLFANLPYDPKKDLALINAGDPTERACRQCRPRRRYDTATGRSHQAQSRQIRLRFDRHRLAVTARHGSNRAQKRSATRACPLFVVAAGNDSAHSQ